MLRQIEPLEVPEPAPGFEEKTWLNVRDHLPERGGFFRRGFLSKILAPQQKWAFAGVMALLLAAAFLAGRFWPRPENPPIASQQENVNPQRIVLVAVGDHLERSQMLLLEIMHNDETGSINFSAEQQLARDLLDDNHLYRVSAQKAGDPQQARHLWVTGLLRAHPIQMVVIQKVAGELLLGGEVDRAGLIVVHDLQQQHLRALQVVSHGHQHDALRIDVFLLAGDWRVLRARPETSSQECRGQKQSHYSREGPFLLWRENLRQKAPSKKSATLRQVVAHVEPGLLFKPWRRFRDLQRLNLPQHGLDACKLGPSIAA